MAGDQGQDHIWAFVDEYGDPNLRVEKAGTSGWFIISAVVVEGGDRDTLEREFEAIRSRHFQAGEAKSSTLAGERHRWEKVVADVSALNFKIVAVAIDKSRLRPDSGFVWPRSFKKYLSWILFERLFTAFPDLHLRIDPSGKPDFQPSFESYIKRRGQQLDLFKPTQTLSFPKSHDDVLVQLADLMCGLLALLRPEKEAGLGTDSPGAAKSQDAPSGRVAPSVSHQ